MVGGKEIVRMSKLLNCPFCGGEMTPDVMCFRKEKQEIMPDLIYVKCYHCGSSSGEGWNKEEAIEKWNRRVN